MWSLGKVINTPEVSRVYIGSFWDKPLHFDMNRKLFEAEELDLFKDIQSLPGNAALRKLNDLIKRARLAKVTAIKLIFIFDDHIIVLFYYQSYFEKMSTSSSFIYILNCFLCQCLHFYNPALH